MHRHLLAVVAVAGMVAACSQDSASPTTGRLGANGNTAPASANDTTGTGSPSTPPSQEPTSTNPVSSVTLSPTSLSIAMGNYGVILATGRDADGVRVANRHPTWVSDDPAIVVAADTGVMYGKAEGTTIVRATIDGHTASASVTVTPATAPPTAPGQAAVSSFDFLATIGGALAGTDTSNNVPVAGATVHLTRIGGASGDTLTSGIDAGTATTDAQGVVTFKGLTGGAYTVDITPPAGSPYVATRTGFGAPREADFRVKYVLRRN